MLDCFLLTFAFCACTAAEDLLFSLELSLKALLLTAAVTVDEHLHTAPLYDIVLEPDELTACVQDSGTAQS